MNAGSRSVLLIGPSSVPYTESIEDLALPALVQAELSRTAPEIAWRTSGIMVFQGPDMADRVRAAVEASEPDLVVLRLATYHLTHEYVLWKVRDRWPALYPAASFVDERLKWLAGGPRDHANTPRPWVYGPPRWLAERVIGASTSRSAASSFANAREALDYLLARENLFLYLWSSSSVDNPKKRAKVEFERNHAEYWREVLDYADRRHVPRFTSDEMRAAEGVDKTKSVDGIHGSLDYRRHQARFLARKVLEGLQLAPPATAIASA